LVHPNQKVILPPASLVKQIPDDYLFF
jgi:hypothetical protein